MNTTPADNDRKTALVLSGGGAKGAWQAGVLQVLLEEGFEFDVLSGVSVGTLNGSMLATGQFDTLIRIWENLRPGQVRTEQSLFTIARKYLAYRIGLGKPPVSKFNNEPLQRMMREHLLGREVKLPFYFGFVKLETGDYVKATVRRGEHAIDEGDLRRLLASTAIPVVFNPVQAGGSVWVDGGLRNISPIKEVLPHGPDRVVIIPTEPLDHVSTDEEVRDIINIAFRTITVMLDEIFQEDIDRFLSINRLVEQAEAEGVTLRKSDGSAYKHVEPLIIAPEESLGSALNFENANVRQLLERGRRRAREVLGKG